MTKDAGKQAIDRLQARLRYFEKRLARNEIEAPLRIWDLLTGPQRYLSPDEIRSEVQRLLAIYAQKGVGAVMPEVCTCRELFEALAEKLSRPETLPSPALLAVQRSENVIRQTRLRGSKFSDYYQDALGKLRKMGLSLTQIEVLREYGLLATDNVTGFHEGRSGKGRILTLRKAIQHVKQTSEQAFYVEMDLQNLCGLNAALGHTRANHVYARIAAIIRKELSAVAAEAVFFRHGGDEMSAFLIDTTGEAIQAAVKAVRSRVVGLAKRSNLAAIPHPKHPGDVRWRGIGVYFGVCRLSPKHEKNLTLVFRHADTELERQKSGSLASSCDRAGVSSTT
jgi:diguanylate cyclase (GGDEF)-like protein